MKRESLSPLERELGQWLATHPPGPCLEDDALLELADLGPVCPQYRERMDHVVCCRLCRDVLLALRRPSPPAFLEWLREVLARWGAPPLLAWAGGLALLALAGFSTWRAYRAEEALLGARRQLVADRGRPQAVEPQGVPSQTRAPDLEHALAATRGLPVRLRPAPLIPVTVGYPSAGSPAPRRDSLTVLAPLASVLGNPPTFQWAAVPGARRYTLAVTGGPPGFLPMTRPPLIRLPVPAKGLGSPVRWTPSVPLPPGRHLFWQVVAYDPQGRVVAAGGGQFRVLGARAVRPMRAVAPLHLKLGDLHAQMDDLLTAEQEYAAIPRGDPLYPLAQRRLQTIERRLNALRDVP